MHRWECVLESLLITTPCLGLHSLTKPVGAVCGLSGNRIANGKAEHHLEAPALTVAGVQRMQHAFSGYHGLVGGIMDMNMDMRRYALWNAVAGSNGTVGPTRDRS